MKRKGGFANSSKPSQNSSKASNIGNKIDVRAEFATVRQVADFYEVGEDTIVFIYSRHSDELESDGMRVVKYKELSNLQYESLKTSKAKVTFLFEDGSLLDFPTRGLKIFTRRAILRDLILYDNVHTTIFYLNKEVMGQQIVNLVKVIGQDELIKRTGGSTKTIEFKQQHGMVEINPKNSKPFIL